MKEKPKNVKKPKERRPKPLKTRLKYLGPFALGVGLLGAALVGLGIATIWTTGWAVSLFAPGATLITVALSSYVAGRGLVSWQEQRERDREAAEYRHREAVYEDLAVFMLSRFANTPATEQDAKLRAKAGLWASAKTVNALKGWHQTKAGISNGAVGVIDLTAEQSVALKAAFAQAVLEMRRDLAPETSGDIDAPTLLASIFDD